MSLGWTCRTALTPTVIDNSFQFLSSTWLRTKRGGRLDVVRVLVAEFHELIIERRPHFYWKTSNDILDEGLGEGDAVKVLHFVELLDDFQIGLQGFNFGGQEFY